MARNETSRQAKKPTERQPPIHIPLDFDTAVGGLLQVNPKEPVESARKRRAKKKPAK